MGKPSFSRSQAVAANVLVAGFLLWGASRIWTSVRTDPETRAKNEFGEWLAFPSELGRWPDQLDVIDHRLLKWPTDGTEREFWLVKYVAYDKTGLADDDVDAGVVGSSTFCFFCKLHQRPPEDGYAVHCVWELEVANLIDNREVEDPQPDLQMLSQWQGGALEQVRIERIAEIASQLKYPQRQVVLAAATRDGQPGWAVFDGPRSAWYAKSDMPSDTDNVILRIHVGRQLLGLTEPVNRQRWLAKSVPRTPEQIVLAYERQLALLRQGGSFTYDDVDTAGTLRTFFPRYVEARCQVAGESRDAVIVATYEQFLNALRAPRWREAFLCWSIAPLEKYFSQYVEARCAHVGDKPATVVVQTFETIWDAAEAIEPSAMKRYKPVWDLFDSYVDAAVESKRTNRVEQMIERLRPHWDGEQGNAKLGAAAFKCGADEIADRFFIAAHRDAKYPHHSATISMQAEIWCRRGQSKQAGDLLLSSLRRIVDESRHSKEPNYYEEKYQLHRGTYLRLFNDASQLTAAGLPASTLPELNGTGGSGALSQ